MEKLIIYLVFAAGLIFGSFLNACIYRLPNNIKISKGFSVCPSCKKRLYWYELIPVLSYIIQGGKCRGCKQHISIRYPMVELLNAMLYTAAYLKFGLSGVAVAAFVFISALICVIFIDFEHMIIPDSLNIAIALAGFAATVLSSQPKLTHIWGIFIISVPLLLIAVISRGGAMGGGDIKLMAAAGFYLGWQPVLVGTFFALLSGGAFGIYKIISEKEKSQRIMPFGPFLAGGAIIALFFGSEIFNWYVGLL